MTLMKLNNSKALQLIQLALMVVVVGLLIWSKPWAPSGSERKISVSGLGTVKETPDSYQFNPSYEETGTDPKVLIEAMTTKANQVTEKLKELGVKEDDIALQSNAYDQKWLDTGEDQTVSFYLTITVEDKKLAQTVQDYLLTTTPQGAISPYPTFSEEKRKQLEKQAREEAIKDARAKAEEIAEETGVKVGKVIEVTDGYSNGDVIPLTAERSLSADMALSLPILTGKHEVSVNVTVSFAIR